MDYRYFARDWELEALLTVRDGVASVEMAKGREFCFQTDSTSSMVFLMRDAELDPTPDFPWWLTVNGKGLGAESLLTLPPASHYLIQLSVFPGTRDYEGILRLPYVEATNLIGLPTHCGCGSVHVSASFVPNGKDGDNRSICPSCLALPPLDQVICTPYK